MSDGEAEPDGVGLGLDRRRVVIGQGRWSCPLTAPAGKSVV